MGCLLIGSGVVELTRQYFARRAAAEQRRAGFLAIIRAVDGAVAGFKPEEPGAYYRRRAPGELPAAPRRRRGIGSGL